MQINRFLMDGFRNYGRVELTFSPGLNLVWGANAQGKSNLLEAICYLGLASSFRLAPDPELINHNQEYFYLRGQIQRQAGPLLLEAAAAVSYTHLDVYKRQRWYRALSICARSARTAGPLLVVNIRSWIWA